MTLPDIPASGEPWVWPDTQNPVKVDYSAHQCNINPMSEAIKLHFTSEGSVVISVQDYWTCPVCEQTWQLTATKVGPLHNFKVDVEATRWPPSVQSEHGSSRQDEDSAAPLRGDSRPWWRRLQDLHPMQNLGEACCRFLSRWRG